MTNFHPRSDWTPVPPANANPVVRKLLKGVAIHWNGPAVSKAANAGDPKAVAAYLEGVRRYHVHDKGWSDIAYNRAVDQAGNVWQLRGWRYQSGANGSVATNDAYLAILCVLGVGQAPSPAMLRTVRHQVRSFRIRYPLKTRIVGHRDIRPEPTDCPGDALERRVKDGTFKPLRKRPRP